MTTSTSVDRSLWTGLLADGRPALATVATALAFAGGLAAYLGVTRQLLPHDLAFLGMAADEIELIADGRNRGQICHTPCDQLDRLIVRGEHEIGTWRAVQMAAVAGKRRRGSHLGDGYRSIVDWVAARADVSHDTARRICWTGSRLAKAPEVAEQLANGDVTFDRAEQVARIPESHRAGHEGFDISQLRRLVAHHRRLTRKREKRISNNGCLHLAPDGDDVMRSVWGELSGLGSRIVEKAVDRHSHDRVGFRGIRKEDSMARDLTVMLEDRPGALADMGEALGRAGVNIDGICGVTGAESGRGEIHILVSDAEAARSALGEAGIEVGADVGVVTMGFEDRPGELGAMARRVADTGTNIELVYISCDRQLVVATDDNNAIEGLS